MLVEPSYLKELIDNDPVQKEPVEYYEFEGELPQIEIPLFLNLNVPHTLFMGAMLKNCTDFELLSTLKQFIDLAQSPELEASLLQYLNRKGDNKNA